MEKLAAKFAGFMPKEVNLHFEIDNQLGSDVRVNLRQKAPGTIVIELVRESGLIVHPGLPAVIE